MPTHITDADLELAFQSGHSPADLQLRDAAPGKPTIADRDEFGQPGIALFAGVPRLPSSWGRRLRTKALIEPIQVKGQTDVRARIAVAFERRLRGLSPMMKQLTLAAVLGGCFGSPADAQTAEANYWLSRILHTRTHFARPYPLPPRRHRIVTQAAAYRPPPSPTIYCGAPCASIPILLGVGF